jgi:hypothetical protein
MKTIWKYSTLPDNEFQEKFTLKMPKGAEILTVQIDQKDNTPSIWVMVETDAPMEERYFELYGTGHEIYVDMGIERKYLGTYQYQRGAFVGHIFERIN